LAYRIIWHEKSVKDLERLGKKESALIIDKVVHYLSRDPVKLGKLLKGNLKLFRRYRIGKFRVIYTIDEKQKLILILKVGNRDSIYK